MECKRPDCDFDSDYVTVLMMSSSDIENIDNTKVCGVMDFNNFGVYVIVGAFVLFNMTVLAVRYLK